MSNWAKGISPEKSIGAANRSSFGVSWRWKCLPVKINQANRRFNFRPLLGGGVEQTAGGKAEADVHCAAQLAESVDHVFPQSKPRVPPKSQKEGAHV